MRSKWKVREREDNRRQNGEGHRSPEQNRAPHGLEHEAVKEASPVGRRGAERACHYDREGPKDTGIARERNKRRIAGLGHGSDARAIVEVRE